MRMHCAAIEWFYSNHNNCGRNGFLIRRDAIEALAIGASSVHAIFAVSACERDRIVLRSLISGISALSFVVNNIRDAIFVMHWLNCVLKFWFNLKYQDNRYRQLDKAGDNDNYCTSRDITIFIQVRQHRWFKIGVNRLKIMLFNEIELIEMEQNI